ncbi:CRISPR-associated helicase Cas3 [Candidatus Synechococcus spongiarum]|uniref:CRISPR-associated helicase Cas3 n=1 Tax=Candidatus Synechococcus spongiarum TaxID=431041 RepID=A0A171DEB7_9SYNE|nr:CRISPR-associated helicase Cas3 [Candidatus Synechococcus spongiarum]
MLLWAKSPAKKSQGDGYPLLPHLLDVAAVAAQLQEVVPCPVPMPCSPSWVTALVGFHALGKATPGFQKKLGRELIPGYPHFPPAAFDRHDASTVPLLRCQLVQREASKSDAQLLASAVGAHHGHLINSVDCRKAGCSA